MVVDTMFNAFRYNSMVDITVLFLLILFLVVSFNTSQVKEHGLDCLKMGVMLTLFAILAKLVCFHTLNKTGNTAFEWLTYVLYYAFNILNILGIVAYVEYLLHVVGEKTKFSKCVRWTYAVLIAVTLGISVARGIQGTLISFDAMAGIWFINTKGLTFEISLYGLLVLGLFVLLVSRKHFIKQVYVSLILTQSFVLLLFIGMSSINDSTFVNFIVLLPLMVILLMLYAVPFNFITGALTYNNFERYLEHKKGKKVNYIVIYFQKDMLGLTFNQDSGKFLYTFWRSYFINCFLFELYTNMYVLAVEDNFITADNLDSVITQELMPFARSLHIDFKIYGMMKVDFIENIGEFFNIDIYFSRLVKKNTYEVFDGPVRDKARCITDIVDSLMDIVEKNDLNDPRVLVYCQPVKHIKTDTFDTAEALMRLNLEKLGIINPDVFIPLAESFNYIHVLSLIILNKTCASIRKLLDEGYNVERISVNFCVKEFKQETFCEEILDIIKSHGIPYDKIAIELTESKNEEDYGLIVPKINQLKEYGIKFYLDDFGTGYSNFDRILGLNLDIVKFDKSLLSMAETNKNTKFVLTHFSSAFKKLDYQILFEGVETDSQITLCVASKADYLQGYKYSKPIAIERLTEFFTKKDEISKKA